MIVQAMTKRDGKVYIRLLSRYRTLHYQMVEPGLFAAWLPPRPGDLVDAKVEELRIDQKTK